MQLFFQKHKIGVIDFRLVKYQIFMVNFFTQFTFILLYEKRISDKAPFLIISFYTNHFHHPNLLLKQLSIVDSITLYKQNFEPFLVYYRHAKILLSYLL